MSDSRHNQQSLLKCILDLHNLRTTQAEFVNVSRQTCGKLWQIHHTSLAVTSDCQELSLVWAANSSSSAGKYWHDWMLTWAWSKCVMQSHSKLKPNQSAGVYLLNFQHNSLQLYTFKNYPVENSATFTITTIFNFYFSTGHFFTLSQVLLKSTVADHWSSYYASNYEMKTGGGKSKKNICSFQQPEAVHKWAENWMPECSLTNRWNFSHNSE